MSNPLTLQLHRLSSQEGFRNPLHPYHWVALYRGAGSIAQFDMDGRHSSLDIDLDRVSEIQVFGHQESPLRIVSEVRPDEVIIFARRFACLSDPKAEILSSFFFGFRFGKVKRMLKVDEHGNVSDVLEGSK